MIATIKTAPTNYPVDLKRVKQHLNIELGNTRDDDELEFLLQMATDEVEQRLRRRLITQTWYFYLFDWPDDDYIKLPFGQLQSVTAVKYTDTDGDESTFSAADYYDVDTDSDPGRIVLKYGENWPTETLQPKLPIEIEFVCGYGDDDADVPKPIRQAILLLIANDFENRESEVVGQGFSRLDTRADKRLLLKYQIRDQF